MALVLTAVTGELVSAQSTENTSKINSYGVLNATGPQASKINSYSVLNSLGPQSSKINSYAVLNSTGSQVAKLVSYAVLAPKIVQPNTFITTKNENWTTPSSFVCRMDDLWRLMGESTK
jgi:hypothetical protein